MKKIIFLFFSILFSHYYLNAQIANGDFAINSGNDETSFQGCPTFSFGSVPNWTRTHGTPSLNASNQIFMFNGGTTGEGIAGFFSFIAGKAYCVDIVLADGNLRHGDFRAFATNGPFTLTPPSTLTCGEVVPSISTTSIGLWDETNIDVNGDNYAPVFSPTSNFGSIWIFPVGAGSGQAEITVSSVNITETCVDELVFKNGPVTHDVYLAQHIKGGTFWGGTTIVSTDPNNFTHFKAGEYVDIRDNFVSAPNTGAAFLATATYYNCMCGGFASRPANNNETNKTNDILNSSFNNANIQNRGELSNRTKTTALTVSHNVPDSNSMSSQSSNFTKYLSDFFILPNPTSSFAIIKPTGNIKYPVSISLKDATGRIITTQTFESGEMKLDLSPYSSGLYLVDVKASGGIKTYKVTKN